MMCCNHREIDGILKRFLGQSVKVDSTNSDFTADSSTPSSRKKKDNGTLVKILDQIDVSVCERGWNVNCHAVRDGRDSLRYLAPYGFRIAIRIHRIRMKLCM